MTLHADVGPAEGNRILRLSRTTKSRVTMRRCIVILHSAQGFSPPKISDMVGLHANTIREVIKAWNSEKFVALEPKYGGGRPKKFSEKQRKQLADLALTRPDELGFPFRQWSLSRLRDAAISRGIVDEISLQWLSVIMDEEALSYQEAKTWKESKDPDFAKKKKKIDSLTRKKHNPPVVVSTDEMGPITLTPKKGRGWHKKTKPHRVPAQYHKGTGVRYWFGAYHVSKNRLWGWLRKKKGGKAWLTFLKSIRAKFPREDRIYLIQDNLSAHWTPEIRSWARENNMTLVPTPTNASWLNPIECRFGELQDLALAGTDYHEWKQVDSALNRAATYRNRRPVRTRNRTPRKVKLPLWKRH